MKKIWCCILLFLLFGKLALAQKDSILNKSFNKGVDFYIKNDFDSAIWHFTKTVELSVSYKLTGTEKYSSTLNNIGQCYKELAKPIDAHKFFFESLENARKNKHLIQVNNALLALNNLHWLIVKNNWQFTYKPIKETFSRYNYFSVEKVEPYNKDSLLVTVYGGTDDGISDMSYKGIVYKRADTIYKTHPDVINSRSIAMGFIKKIEANRTYLVVKHTSTLPIEAYDQVDLFCQTPVACKKSSFIDILKYNINFIDYTKTDQLISRRFLFYYSDDLVDFEFIKIFKQEITEIQYKYAKDTLNNTHQLATKAENGIFKNQNVIKALETSVTKHIKCFLHFICEYPGKYIGNSFSFVDVYATWIYNETPLAKNDFLNYIVAQEPTTRVATAVALLKQIEKNNMEEQWILDGLNYFESDDIINTRILLFGLSALYKANNNSNTLGWFNFFNGLYHYKTSELKTADSSFVKAIAAFSKTNNNEGLTMCHRAIDKLKLNNRITMQVQSGHFSSYKVAMHPNSKYYATAGFDNFIRIWNIELGKEVTAIKAHNDAINEICYSPNGRYLASCSDDTTIKIWSTFDYSLINTLYTNKPEFALAFSPNNKQLATGGVDSLIKIWDFVAGTIFYNLKKHKGKIIQLSYVQKEPNLLYSAGLDSMVYAWDLNTKEDIYWYKKNARLLNMKVSSNGNFLFYTANDTTINVWNLLKNKFYFSSKLSFSRNGTTNNFGEADFSPDGDMLIYPDRKNNVIVADLPSGYNLTLLRARPYESYLNSLNFTANQQKILATHPFSGQSKIIDFKEFKAIQTFKSNSVNYKQYKSYANPTLNLQFSADEKSLYIIHNRLSKYNLTNGNTQHLFFAPQYTYGHNFMLTDSVAMQTPDEKTIEFYNQYTRKAITQKSLSNLDVIKNYYVYAKTIYIAGKKGLIEAYKLKDLQIDSTSKLSLQLPLKQNEEVKFIKVDSFHHNIYIASTESKIYCINLKTKIVTNVYSVDDFADFAITPTAIYINLQNGFIVKKNSQTFETVRKIKAGDYQDKASFIKANHSYTKIIAYVNETDFAVIDALKDTIMYTKKAHDYYAFDFLISSNDKLLVTSGFDNKINLFKLETGEELLNIFTPADLDFVAADKNGNYFATKKSLEGLSFKLNDKLYSFDQFDLKFNRPDLILQKTGVGDTTLITAYKKAHAKRLEKAGFKNEQEINSSELPYVSFINQTEVDLFTKEGFTELTIECFDPKYSIKSLHVVVNNNPIYGVAGKNLNSRTTDTIINLKIPLAYDKNSIKIYCTNSRGQNSLQQSLEIKSSYKKNPEPKTWFIGIGVSNYKDASMNLRYAAKDIRDLVGTFSKGKPKNAIIIDTLINEKATLKNILALKEKLKLADINDKIIVAVTGHGLLNKKLDFYYATHDVDFNNPELKGLKYEALEGLFDSVAAQHKLLLIDACHSGALDKETILESKNGKFEKLQETDSGTVKAASRSSIKVNKSKVSLNNTFELMQNLFVDFNNNNGGVVISAAGGLEYAFESPVWNNGVFTYCVRKALEDGEAGYGLDITVQQLMDFVSTKVSELTNGKQKPTSRRESLAFNWVVQ